MRTLVAVLVIFATAQLAIAAPDDDSKRERLFRALSIADELKLDDTTIGRLFPVLSAYEQDRDKLADELAALNERIGKTTDPATVDKLLDRTLATQRALIAVDVKLVVRLRQLLPADQAARARVMLVTPTTSVARTPVQDPVAIGGTPPRRRGHDPETLFPPGSELVASCDPFAQMHRCPE